MKHKMTILLGQCIVGNRIHLNDSPFIQNDLRITDFIDQNDREFTVFTDQIGTGRYIQGFPVTQICRCGVYGGGVIRHTVTHSTVVTHIENSRGFLS